MTEGKVRCPAYREATDTHTSNGIGPACSETGMSGNFDMRGRCPIRLGTNADCYLTPGDPISIELKAFQAKWAERQRKQQEVERGLQG